MFSAIKRWFKNTKKTPAAPVVMATPTSTTTAPSVGGRGLYWPRARQSGPAYHPGDSRSFLATHTPPA